MGRGSFVTEALTTHINPNQIKAEKSGGKRWSVCRWNKSLFKSHPLSAIALLSKIQEKYKYTIIHKKTNTDTNMNLLLNADGTTGF